jgi:hypothetical protein
MSLLLLTCRAVFITGVGLYQAYRNELTYRSFTDAYQLFAVAFAIVMFGYVYGPVDGALPSASDTAIKISSSVGAAIGQFGFGVLSDILGRKKVHSPQIESD